MIAIRWILAALLAAQLGGLPAVASEVCQAVPATAHSCCAPDSASSELGADPRCGCCVEPAFPVPSSSDLPAASPEARDGMALLPGSAAAVLPAALTMGRLRTAPERYGPTFPSFLDGSGFRC
ncbi:MAG TPA: hypothetical protein VK911_09265 [Vicinamibacterales bacterium]|nr:hypothetical protein [Vicinamibacterales bacterium]